MQWGITKIDKAFVFIRNGITIKQENEKGGVPITRIETISKGDLDFSKLGFADINDDRFSDYYLRNGDILMSHINSWAHLGKCALVKDIDRDIIHGMNLLLLRSNEKVIYPSFAKYFFDSPIFKSQLHRISNQSVNQSSFAVTKLKNLLIPLPPLPIQRAIADRLDRADALRQKDRQLLQAYDDLAQAVFVEMFGDPVRNEKGWEVRKLFEIVEPTRPITYGILMPGENIVDGIPYIRVVDIKNGSILVGQIRRTSHKIASEYERSILKKGDLLISIRGHVGRLAIVPKVLEGANITQDTARLALNHKITTPEYVQSYLENTQMQIQLARYTKGVAVKGINLSDLRNIQITIPPHNLQTRFATLLANIEQQKDLVRRQQAGSEALFGRLLQDAFG